eukprot:CAMPEP_0184693196 /NCGR_PEP_ID=MMETSP0313-20130426/1476_1 /TAXON_ID=2792 /ORGANISM="Porphyridium aerugineum, Strain SAG 1380-2" /LENGTH=337 /DNA_ID=CAMNT_0027151209 /DNA_START=38 /DNA_END=1048 /DNA_ORIENTATION=-
MALATVSTRNRLQEFLRTVEVMKTQQPSRGDGTSGNESFTKSTQGPPTKSRSQFALAASAMAGDIQRTSLKLKRLTELAQRRSLFDDPASEIQELTFVIKQDIAQLNNKLEQLQYLQNNERGHLSKQAGDHTGSVVVSLKGRLMDTANEFKTVLKMRTDSLQAQQTRRSQFLGEAVSKPSNAPSNKPMGSPYSSSSSLNGNGNSVGASRPDAGSADIVIDLGSGSTAADGLGGSSERHAQFRQQLQMARPEGTYLQARADAVRQVEATVAELGQIFSQLAAMVSEQGEMIERIDANVDDTISNIDEGRNQLMRYYNSISSNRGLVLKIFATVFIFMI